jgi:hypothetical protein
MTRPFVSQREMEEAKRLQAEYADATAKARAAISAWGTNSVARETAIRDG